MSTLKLVRAWARMPGRQLALFAALTASAGLSMVCPAAAQVVFSGDKGGFTVSAGVTASGYEEGYGNQKLIGIGGIVDADTRRRIGFEGEAHWMDFHQTNGLKVTTWQAGPRYHLSRGRMQFYVKGLLGLGHFTFPYNYAHGSYFVVSPGGGLDYRWKRRITIRAVDAEYQYWPQFTFGAMSAYSLSAGVRYHIF
jgi:hypothetical protein